MRVVLLHSDVHPDAPPDELDTLVTADAVAAALSAIGHEVRREAFIPDMTMFDHMIAGSAADIVFNLVESVFGQDNLAGLAPALFESRALCFTGASASVINCCADKPFTKRLLRAAGLPTPDWSEAPRWDDLAEDKLYIVKSAIEDCSVGLDDASVVRGRDAIRARAAECIERHGGIWFAESYCSGREFNISLLETSNGPRILPIAEIGFSDWQPERPRLVGYAAKWDSQSADSVATSRVFGVEAEAPELARRLEELCLASWHLFGLRGYARVDVRLDAAGAPTILEINPNPCLEPEAGFAAAALRDGITYPELIEQILNAAIRR